jgi:signal transduction histidine kinase
MREYVRKALDENEGLTSQVEAALAHSPAIYEVTIVARDGAALISSDASLTGRPVPRRTPLEQLASSDFIEQLRTIYGSMSVYEVTLAFNLGSEPFGEIRVATEVALLRAALSPTLRSTALLAIAAIVISTLLAMLVSHVSLAPLAKISAQLDRIAAGEFEPGMEAWAGLAARSDELGQVSTKIRQIGQQLSDLRKKYSTREEQQLDRLTQLRVSERQAARARLTAGVAHEVKNPLNSMRLWLQNLKENLSADQEIPQQAMKVLDNEIDRLDGVVKRFLDFMRPVELQPEEADLAGLVREVLDLARPQIERAKVEATSQFSDGIPPAYVDRQLIKQAVLNLVLNAIEAMPTGGRLTLALARRGETAEITVSDTGRGIAPEHRGKVFQLFFTTRPGGSGIGLATAARIVQDHNGSIDFGSEMDRGTTFRIRLPLAASIESLRGK